MIPKRNYYPDSIAVINNVWGYYENVMFEQLENRLLEKFMQF
jgi:hypothetical protein